MTILKNIGDDEAGCALLLASGGDAAIDYPHREDVRMEGKTDT